MDLNLFLSAIKPEIVAELKPNHTFHRNIQINTERMPDIHEADIAIVGLLDHRGTDGHEGISAAADEIRKKLYRLKKGTGAYRIVDLGNMRNGVTLEETYARIQEVCRILLEADTFPLLIGGSHDLTYGQFQSYEAFDLPLTVLNVDAALDMETQKELPENQRHLHRMLMHEPNYLYNMINIGYQSYLTDTHALDTLEKLNFDAYRLGQLRPDIQDMEPAIRNADMLSFDLTAVKATDAPGSTQAQIFGLSGEEACQLCWYAGMNDKLTSAGFYEYNPHFDDEQHRTASLVAIMIWYLIEGYYSRKGEKSFIDKNYLKYVVSMDGAPREVIFYKSKLSEKWWMQVPSFDEQNSKPQLQHLIPCNYQDYQTATKGQLPERLVNALARLV